MIYMEFISDANKVEVVFNTLSSDLNIAMHKASFNKELIMNVWYSTADYVSVKFMDGNEWYFNLDGSNGFLPVSLMDGVAPTSLEDIYNYFKSLI